jgi:phosphodiesterase/alkaline phosphatase D-like protein
MKNTVHMMLGPIIGGLSHDRVRLWARADGPSTLCAWIAARRDQQDARRLGRVKLTAATGFAGVLTVDGLKPATRYFYALTLASKPKPPKKDFLPFTTFPAPGKATSFRFSFGSCFRPEGEHAGRAFEHLLKRQAGLSFLMMLGDQVYSDEWRENGLGHAAMTLDDYRAAYCNIWHNQYHRALLARTPVFMILDDHEVDNDWHWTDFEHRQAGIPFYSRLLRWLAGRPAEERGLTRGRVLAALQANWEHQAMYAPASLTPEGPLFYDFEYGAAAFFVLDSRTQRVYGRQGHSMLGEAQWNALTDWFRRVKETHPVKFVITSTSILSQIYGDFTNERWSAFKDERERLLFFLADEGIEGVHFLAGDLHSGHCISAKLSGPDGKAIPVREFCSSPFEQNPNKLARLLQHPAHSPALKERKRHFVVTEINYGVVQVDFSRTKKPKVTFRLHYQEGGIWRTRLES